MLRVGAPGGGATNTSVRCMAQPGHSPGLSCRTCSAASASKDLRGSNARDDASAGV